MNGRKGKSVNNIWKKEDFQICGLGKKSKFAAKIKHFKRCMYWSWQRVIRGYAECDKWNMYVHLQNLIPEMLQDLRDNRMGSPGYLGENYTNKEGILVNDTCHAEWNKILDHMIFLCVAYQYLGYHMLLLYTAAKSVPFDVTEAAMIDGASEWRIAWNITLPLIKPMIKTCVTFAVIGSLKFFDLVWILTKGGPLHASEVPTTLMYTTIFNRNEYGIGSAIAIFVVLECLMFYLLIDKLFKIEHDC